jgi:hypothetical protein
VEDVMRKRGWIISVAVIVVIALIGGWILMNEKSRAREDLAKQEQAANSQIERAKAAQLARAATTRQGGEKAAETAPGR